MRRLGHIIMVSVATFVGEVAAISVTELPWGWWTLAVPPAVMAVLAGVFEWLGWRAERSRSTALRVLNRLTEAELRRHRRDIDVLLRHMEPDDDAIDLLLDDDDA